MKIIAIDAYLVEVPYKTPYTISPGTVRKARRVLVEARSDTGVTGIGETGVTVPERGGETVEAIVSSIRSYFAPLLLGRDPHDVAGAIAALERANWGRTGFLCAKCGVDNALFDLLGHAYGIPVYKLLGGAFRDRVSVSRSLSIGTPAAVAADALRKKADGYACLTVKAGFDPRADLECVAAVRDAVGTDYPLEVDVNGGYTADVAVPVLRRMEQRYHIRAVEQPCAWWDFDGMAKVADALEIPVIADESAWTPPDVIRLARERAADVVCIKVIKNGGFYLSRKIAETAEAAGLPVTLGSKHPLGPGTAAILHFAAALPNLSEPVGYGTPRERLADDIITHDIEMIDGIVAVPQGPGLGVTLDPGKVERYRCS
ncbi:MAG TPA: enolase C-terminal domain-like protein [bacterium]|nr:enolase C-terminal domain-like protein [bacterium]